MKSIAGESSDVQESAEWYIYNLDANATEGAFGANAKEKFVREGKYYTTMYADFAYQCLDDVNAYYLANSEDEEKPNYDEVYKIVYLNKITDRKVPANMAVVNVSNFSILLANLGKSALNAKQLRIFHSFCLFGSKSARAAWCARAEQAFLGWSEPVSGGGVTSQTS